MSRHRGSIQATTETGATPAVGDCRGIELSAGGLRERSRARLCPALDELLKFHEAICQGGRAGLQDERRFDLVHVLMLYSRNLPKTRPYHDPYGPELLATP